jgi:amino acid permease
MLSGTLIKIVSIFLLLAVGIVLALGIANLFRGGSKKNSNKLMQLRVFLQFIAIIILVSFAYFFKN